jgi:ArsR family transcriptional regulator
MTTASPLSLTAKPSAESLTGANQVDGVLCCAPITGTPISPEDAEKLAALLKAIAEPTRLRLLSLVAAHEGGEACVCDLTDPVGLSQPTVSHHLKILVDAGLLTREKRGVWAYYRLVPGRLSEAARALDVNS